MAKKRSHVQLGLCERIQGGVGQNIVAARTKAGKLQRDLAAALDVSRVTLSNIERGRQRLYLDQLYQAAQFLRIDVRDLLPTVSEVSEMGEVETVTDAALPPEVNERARKIIAEVLNSATAAKNSSTTQRNAN